MTGRIQGLVLAALVLPAGQFAVYAQEIEPRAYSNAPIGINFLVAGYAYTKDGFALDPALPVVDPQIETSNTLVGYGRVIDLWGQSAKINLILPHTWLSGSAEFAGEAIQREVNGLGDSSFKLSVNLYGAPALSLKAFANYQQDLIIGTSLRVIAPTGQYDSDKLVNIGSNRWTFTPELGVSKALDRWTLEGAAAVTLYTDNNDFLGGHTRSQEPLYSMQAHAIYSFPKGIWSSLDATYFTGGRTTIDGRENQDLQQNWRVGATLALPLDVHNSIKLYASSGIQSRTGNDYDLFGVIWQYRWGGGL